MQTDKLATDTLEKFTESRTKFNRQLNQYRYLGKRVTPNQTTVLTTLLSVASGYFISLLTWRRLLLYIPIFGTRSAICFGTEKPRNIEWF